MRPPYPEPPSHLPPYPIPLGCPRPPALGALLHALNSHWSSVLHMVIYTFQCYSLKSSHPHLLPLSPKVCSLYLYLLCCPTCRIVGTIFLNSIYICNIGGFLCSSVSKESAYDTGGPGSISRLGRSSKEGNGNPLQYSCLENSMD